MKVHILYIQLLYVAAANNANTTKDSKYQIAIDTNWTAQTEIFKIGFSITYEELSFNELIGRGSYGSVHKGILNGKVVALKRIPIPHGMDVSRMVTDNREIAALK